MTIPRSRPMRIATRADTRVELVLDRSNSMSGNIGALRTSATTFVNKFNPGVDELGLIAYGGSAFVAYPTTKTLSTTGPSIHFADTPAQGQDNMLTMISSLAAGSDTGTAEGLYLAWQEIKKAHSIDNDPTKLNAIVLFTDGVPNGFTAYFNDPANTSIKSTSACTYKISTGAANQMKGWMASTCSGTCTGLNFFNPANSLGTGSLCSGQHGYHAKRQVLGQPHPSTTWSDITGTPVSGCAHLNGTDLGDLAKIPATDQYGASTSSAAINQCLLYHYFRDGV